ncbi:hypothetical protein ATCC90586_006983 [Pythium insidiosum]|nr:hypothetical protein ATCC90586_006983 [Pythium insidiosum]
MVVGRRWTRALLALCLPGAVQALWFDGPTIDGDALSWVGEGKAFNPKKAFSGKTDKIARVELSNWDMSALSSLSIPASVTSLSLIQCKLAAIPTEIDALTQLTTLNLAGNSLTSVDSSFGASSKLTTLNLTQNQLTSFAANIPSLQSLDLSKNMLASIPTSIFSAAQLSSFFIEDNAFKIETVTIQQFDFFAGLRDFRADFVNVAVCSGGSDVVTLKGARVCRLSPQQSLPPQPTIILTPSPSPSPIATPHASDANASGSIIAPPRPVLPSSSTDTSTSDPNSTFIAYGMVFVLFAVGAIAALYKFIAHRQAERRRGALHEETPLFFDSDKRNTYHQELTAGDKLFPSNDPVLVTWRLDYDAIKLVRRLAKGAFGEVWIGRYRGHRVAVKRLLEEQLSFEASEDFIREIKLMAWLKHPKVLEFVGVAWTRLVDMLAVTEFMDSGDLRSLLDARRDLTWPAAKLRFALDTIDAIVYLHSLNPVIIHRDLKSRNILVDSKKGAKLGDFGISAAKRQDREMTTGVGTARWLAPELARGDTHYNEAVDVYSFGVILCELDTHELPFQDARGESGERLSDFAILQGVAMGTLQVRVSESCPAKIRRLAERCVALEPSERPTAAEVAFLLRRRDVLLDDAPDSAGGFV